MSGEQFARLRPADVTRLWGGTVSGLIDLWRTALTTVLELGYTEQDVPAERYSDVRVRLEGGQVPRLVAHDLVGETFGVRLAGRWVLFRERERVGDYAVVECRLDEAFDGDVPGDVYRGEVVRENGTSAGAIALDAGS